MANSIAFLDALQGMSYQTLSSIDFKLAIVDPDSSGLTSSQLGNLESSGKSVVGYLSIGEAEDYRSYWQSSWDSSKPSWMLDQNPNWGSYYVKFWDPAWQNIVLSRATEMAKAGYDGIMLDVVDVYGVSQVANADGGFDHARSDMMAFVQKISAATKAINPDFKIIQNNALDLLVTDPDNPASATNTAHLSYIDGVLAESTFYNSDNSPTSWGQWNEQYLLHAVDAGKTVLAIDYPSSASAQNAFIDKAIADGFVPYVATQSLDGNINPINYQIPSELPSGAMASLLDGQGTTPLPVTSTNPTTPTEPTDTSVSAEPTTPVTSPDPTTPTEPTEPSVSAEPMTPVTSPDPTTTPTQPATPSKPQGSNNNDYLYHNSHHDNGEGASGQCHVTNIPNGKHTVYANTTYAEFDVRENFHGKATVMFFGRDAHDIIGIDKDLYATPQEVIKHVTYHGNDAVIHLPDGHGTVTIHAAGPNSLIPADFHII